VTINRHRVAGRVLHVLLTGFIAAVVQIASSPANAEEVIRVSGSQRTATVYVASGKSQDVRTEERFVDITVGDPTIADVNPLTDHTLSILGKKNGTTRVTVYGEGKKLVGIFDVEVGYETARIAAELKRRFPHARLNVSSINGRLMLSGETPDAVTADKALTVVRQFAADAINSVSVSSPQQVMLEVRFVEISRTAERGLGVHWGVRSGRAGGDRIRGVSLGDAATGVLSGTSPFGFVLGRLVSGSTKIDVLIKGLEEQGVARSLAQPNLVALSGDTASFLAGGEFPIPVPGSLGTVGIEYKRYGVGLAFTPTVLSGGLINLKIEPEVSQLDFSNPITIGAGAGGAAISVPPLIVRRASTTIELRDGQSFALAGLLQNVGTNAQDQVPWLGSVPVLGALFRSASYQKNETDLVIIVTPRLVRPAAPGNPLKTPLTSTVMPNDTDFFLYGNNELSRRRLQITEGAGVPLSGHIIDLPKRGSNVVRVRN
jgi:pilus assembly protein CpaC